MNNMVTKSKERREGRTVYEYSIYLDSPEAMVLLSTLSTMLESDVLGYSSDEEDIEVIRDIRDKLLKMANTPL